MTTPLERDLREAGLPPYAVGSDARVMAPGVVRLVEHWTRATRDLSPVAYARLLQSMEAD